MTISPSNPKPGRKQRWWLLLLFPGVLSALMGIVVRYFWREAGFLGPIMIGAGVIGGTLAAYRAAKQSNLTYQQKATLAVLLAPFFIIFAVALTFPGCAMMLRIGPPR